ncbi:MAG: hypothetical protein P4L87_07320 [Formivibrio sp.]|nr:hypothetical protein [Formivibrio sp.]
MTEADTNNLASLRAIYPTASIQTEGSKAVVLMPEAKFSVAGKMEQMALLLVPFEHSGYVTRLFFERRLEGAGQSQNWTEHMVLSRKWWAPSWKDVVATQPWVRMLCAHLRAVA